MPSPERSAPAPIPRLTVIAFGSLAGFALILTLVLHLLGESVLFVGLGFVGGAIALTSVIVAVVRREDTSIQRFEQRLRRFWKPPRRFRLTREGKWFVGITIVLGLGAVNTGNNLLYLLLGMLLSLILGSGVLSEMSLRGLEIERDLPGRAEATRAGLVGIAVRNGKARLPSFSIEVEDLLVAGPIDRKCYFLKLPAGRRQTTSYRHAFPRRGRYVFTGFRVSTRFPFGLITKSRDIEAPGQLVVLPKISPVAFAPAPRQGQHGDEERARRGKHGDFFGLREMRDGDDPRELHWRSTARRGRPMMREREDEAARRVTVFVDNAVPGGAGSVDLAALDRLEEVVSLGASLAVHYLERGFAVRVVSRGLSVPSGTGPLHRESLLRGLALLPAAEDDAPWSAGAERGANAVTVDRFGVRGAGPSGPTGTAAA